MSETLLIDAHGECRLFGSAVSPAPSWSSLAEALPECDPTSARLLTDWGPGAVAGVATVQGSAATAPALLEKQLRDRGETDDICHLMVHESQSRMGSTELAYTAIPLKTWQKYQQLVAHHPQLVLLHDWTRTLLHWARQHELADGGLMVMHPQGLDVLILQQGRAQALERLRVFQDETQAWDRLARRALALIQENAPADSAGAHEARPLVLWLCAGAEAAWPAFRQGLAPMQVSELWAEAPDRLEAGTEPAAHTLDAAALLDSLPLRQSISRPQDKAAAWADRWLQPIGLAGLTLSLLMAITAGVMHYRTQLALAAQSAEAPSQALWQTLNTDVQQADRLSEQQKPVRQWLQQRLSGNKVPDMVGVLARLRLALPPGIVIDEVGLVVEKDSHLVTVIGHTQGVEDSLHSESAFAQALQADGFTMQKRELLLRDNQPKFKLSMTWSAS